MLQVLVEALQSFATPAEHVKVAVLQVSAPLQALPSSQSLLFWQLHKRTSLVQPAVSEQLSIVQATPSLHTKAAPRQVPAWHISPLVHVLPSLHVVPSASAGAVHVPVAGVQVPAAWHSSMAAQVFAAPAVHAPDTQESPLVHILPSSQLLPSGLAGVEHCPLAGKQTPAV